MNRLLLACSFAVLALAANANSLVQIRTPLGDIEAELFDTDRPVTVANFKRYIEAGAWKDMFSHRIIADFVMQAGGFVVTNRNTPDAISIQAPSFGEITNEFGVGPRISNTFGTMAMAKVALSTNQVTIPAITNIVNGVTNITPASTTNVVVGGPNSATSQWFINLTDNSVNLDVQNGGFTVFGRVVGGTNVLGLMNTFRHGAGATTNRLYNFGDAFTDLPSLSGTIATIPQLFTNLVYLDVTLLEVRVVRTAGGREISWRSSPGGTNIVEFTTEFPPVWQALKQLEHPTADRSTVVDPVNDPRRFYRVRVAH